MAGLSGLKAGDTKRPGYKELYGSNVQGGFTSYLYRRVTGDKIFLLELAFILLNRYFPKYQHTDLLETMGIPHSTKSAMTAGATSFIQDVLQVYRHRCAVCEYSAELDDVRIAVQVAYIK